MYEVTKTSPKSYEGDVIAKFMMNVATFERSYVFIIQLWLHHSNALLRFWKRNHWCRIASHGHLGTKNKNKVWVVIGSSTWTQLGVPLVTHTEFLNPNHSPSPSPRFSLSLYSPLPSSLCHLRRLTWNTRRFPSDRKQQQARCRCKKTRWVVPRSRTNGWQTPWLWSSTMLSTCTALWLVLQIPFHSIPFLNSHTGSLECTHSIPRSSDWDGDYHLHGISNGNRTSFIL